MVWGKVVGVLAGLLALWLTCDSVFVTRREFAAVVQRQDQVQQLTLEQVRATRAAVEALVEGGVSGVKGVVKSGS